MMMLVKDGAGDGGDDDDDDDDGDDDDDDGDGDDDDEYRSEKGERGAGGWEQLQENIGRQTCVIQQSSCTDGRDGDDDDDDGRDGDDDDDDGRDGDDDDDGSVVGVSFISKENVFLDPLFSDGKTGSSLAILYTKGPSHCLD